jgi:hypothetical protein
MPIKHTIWKVGRIALDQCFKQVKKVGTPVFFEWPVAEIDVNVRLVRIPG